MKKNAFFLALLLCASVTALAQNSLLATLNHSGVVSTFYGATALKEAHNAAESGDVITLSSGTFLSVDITKAITVRGAGMDTDSITGRIPTILTGDFAIQVSDTLNNKLTLEGIYHNHKITVYGTLKNALFLKSRLKNFTYYNLTTTIMNNLSFIHCKIMEEIRCPSNSSISCINCYVEDPVSYTSTTSIFEFVNCVIDLYNSYQFHSSTTTFQNCIIRGYNSTDYLGSSCSAYNCIAYNSGSMFKNIPNSTNKIVTDVSSLFKTFGGTDADDNENFELTDAAKTTYLGLDGTQVGIHGGTLPFDSTPTNPQITKCNVAAKSTADGKLSVDIEVNAAE